MGTGAYVEKHSRSLKRTREYEMMPPVHLLVVSQPSRETGSSAADPPPHPTGAAGGPFIQ